MDIGEKTPEGRVALSVSELCKLLSKLMGKVGETLKQILYWSNWWRRYQYKAQQYHSQTICMFFVLILF